MEKTHYSLSSLSGVIITTALAVVLNPLAIFVLKVKRGATRFVDMLFISMAVSDFFQAIIVFPFDVVALQKGRFPFDINYCSAIAFLHTFLALTSIAHFTILAAARACVIWRPIKFKMVLEKTGVRAFLISLGWGYALVWSIMPLLGWANYGIEPNGIICSVDWTQGTSSSKAYIYCLFFFCFIIPVVAMIGSIVSIFMLKKMRMNQNDASANANNQQTPKSRSWKTLLVFLMFGKSNFYFVFTKGLYIFY